MGIFSWFSRKSRGAPEPDQAPSLLRYRYDDPAREAEEQAAAADVAAVEQDDKFFGADSPANRDQGI